jgi:hypothetical protein
VDERTDGRVRDAGHDRRAAVASERGSLVSGRPQLARVEAGDLLNLVDQDYLYGAGALQLRVTVVHESQPMPDWIQVTGEKVLWNGNRGGQCTVFVRKAAIGHAKARTAR